MGLLSFIPSIFSLDTLDPRLDPRSARSSSPPKPSSAPSLNSSNGESSRSRQIQDSAKPPLWKTPEFFLYYVVFAVCVPMMFKVTYELSQESHPNYKRYRGRLSKGWLFGRKVDNSDMQYASFRDNIPTLAGVLVLHFILRWGSDVLFNLAFPQPPENSSYRPAHNLNRRKYFDILFASIFLFVLHGLSIFKILFIILVNFLISYFHPSSPFVPILTWVFNVGILFANEAYDGYRYRDLLPWLIAGEGSGVGYAMDHVLGGGIMPRWHTNFKMTVLRMISYNMDLYWAACRAEDGNEDEAGSVIEVGPLPSSRRNSSELERGRGREAEERDEERRLIVNDNAVQKKHADPSHMSERDRISTPAPLDQYSLPNYISYALYTPLYLAGPILVFNDFLHQCKHSTPTLSSRRTFLYALRTFFSILTMEFVLHYLYVTAISKRAPYGSLKNLGPFQLAMIGYFSLHIIWLKLMIPWRFFRLWSLVDGIDPPENMIRCMSNNFSALSFWRAWHRSFNRWTVRYVYVPIGGARRPILNMLAVFTFVALWHDISLKLLTWGWLIVLFVAPELAARKLVKKERIGAGENAWRWIKGVGAVGNVLMMMVANLVGFALGVDGVKELLAGIMGSWSGIGFFIGACAALFVGVQVMLEIREEEKRKGIDLRC